MIHIPHSAGWVGSLPIARKRVAKECKRKAEREREEGDENATATLARFDRDKGGEGDSRQPKGI